MDRGVWNAECSIYAATSRVAVPACGVVNGRGKKRDRHQQPVNRDQRRQRLRAQRGHPSTDRRKSAGQTVRHDVALAERIGAQVTVVPRPAVFSIV
jgi:hypothetical protein